MFAGHYFGASDGSRGGERGFINRQLFSSLEKAVGLFAGGVENASRAVAVSSIGLLSGVLRGCPFCRVSSRLINQPLVQVFSSRYSQWQDCRQTIDDAGYH